MNPSLLYVRVSSKDQEKEGYSLDAQEKLGYEYAQRKGLTITRSWKVSESAWRSERTAFNQLVECAKRHSEIEHVIFDITDRMTRNDFDKLKIYTLIKDFNKTIHFSRSNKIINKESTSEDVFMLDIEVAVAKKMSNDISRKSKMGMLEKAEQGLYPSIASIGYKNNLVTHLLEVNEDMAPYVKKAFVLMASGSCSLDMIADTLYQEGLRNKRNNRAGKSAIAQMLNNPIYYGAFRWQGKLYEGSHTPLISKELFDKAQAALHSKGRPSITKRGFAFNNLLVCSDCGCKILGEQKKKKYNYYHCTFSKGRHNGIGYVPENRLAHLFEESVKRVALKPALVDWLKGALKQKDKHGHALRENRAQALHKELEKANARLSRLYDARFDGELEEGVFKAKEGEYKAQALEIKTQMGSLEKTNPRFYEDACQILELSKRLYPLYVKVNLEDKAKILKALASNYHLTDVSIAPTYRKPFDLLAKGLSRTTWLPTMDAKRTTRGRSKYQEIHILVKMYRRRGRGTAISLYDPLPSRPLPVPPVYKNIVAMAVRVQDYLAESPQSTYTTAGAHFGVTRSRVSQLMTLLEKLPENFTSLMKTTEDQSLLKRFSGKALLRIASLSTTEQRETHITTLRNQIS